MSTFIRVTEIWTPDRDGRCLTLRDGIYGELDHFRDHSAKVTFAHGEGLPGTAWKTRAPVILKTFEGSVFKRTAEAHEAGLTAAIGLPVFCGEFLNAVIVFLCGQVEKLAGAIEVWEQKRSTELGLRDGFYGEWEKFESLSKSLVFQRGRGLPGLSWETGLPEIMGNLETSNSFLRAKVAAEAGIRTGIAIPFYSTGPLDAIVTFLSSTSTPIARRFEIWKPNEDRSRLRFEGGIEENSDSVEVSDAGRWVEFGKGPIGMTWATGVPRVEYHGDTQLLTIPIIEAGSLNSVVALYS
ncbi:MAG: GAF domain-containing protein [Verrucomicrobiota bacterium]